MIYIYNLIRYEQQPRCRNELLEGRSTCPDELKGMQQQADHGLRYPFCKLNDGPIESGKSVNIERENIRHF